MPADLLRALAPLVRRLRRHRRSVDILSVAAAGAVGATFGLILARLGFPWTFDDVSGLAAGAAVLVAGALAIRHGRDPLTPLAAARRAERDPVWRERLTTALEHGARGGAVPGALLTDAITRAARLDAARTAPWRWPRRTLGVLIAATLAVSVLVAVPERFALRIGTGATTEAERAPTAAAVAELATEVATAARRTRDAYLATLAEQLQELAQDSGTEPLESAALADLDELLEAIAAARGGGLTADGLREDLIARGEALDAAAAAHPEETATSEASTTTGSDAGAAGSAPTDGGLESASFGAETEHPEASVGSGPSQSSAPGEGEFDPSLLDDVREASPSDGPPPIGAPGELIGAAEEAGAGDSRLAGRGSQALEGEAGTADFTDAAAEAVALSGSERDEGRHIEVELPPAEEWEGYDPARFTVGAWRTSPESPVTTDPIPLRYREAAGRFFLPSQETAASR